MAGHHSLVPLVATVHLKIHQSLCIQASKYMYMMFRYGPLSLYHQITTAPTTHICSRLHVLVHKQHTHTHTCIPDSLLQILHSRIYMIKMHKTVNSTVVLQQREGAHA